MSKITEMYMGHNCSVEALSSIRKWVKKTLDKGISPVFFEERWGNYIDNDGEPTDHVPGVYYDELESPRFWIDALCNCDNYYDLSLFYKECYYGNVNYITIKNQDIHYHLIGERRMMKKAQKKKIKKKKPLKKVAVDFTRFEIMDMD